MIRIVSLAIRIVDWAVLLYCVLSWVMPQSDLYRSLSAFVDPVLNPIRNFLRKYIPALNSVPVDLSPLVLFLILNLLSRIF